MKRMRLKFTPKVSGQKPKGSIVPKPANVSNPSLPTSSTITSSNISSAEPSCSASSTSTCTINSSAEPSPSKLPSFPNTQKVSIDPQTNLSNSDNNLSSETNHDFSSVSGTRSGSVENKLDKAECMQPTFYATGDIDDTKTAVTDDSSHHSLSLINNTEQSIVSNLAETSTNEGISSNSNKLSDIEEFNSQASTSTEGTNDNSSVFDIDSSKTDAANCLSSSITQSKSVPLWRTNKIKPNINHKRKNKSNAAANIINQKKDDAVPVSTSSNCTSHPSADSSSTVGQSSGDNSTIDCNNTSNPVTSVSEAESLKPTKTSFQLSKENVASLNKANKENFHLPPRRSLDTDSVTSIETSTDHRVYRERKQKFHHKLSEGELENNMTMFDLIFYNPANSPMPGRETSNTRGRKRSRDSEPVEMDGRIAEEAVDDVSEVGTKSRLSTDSVDSGTSTGKASNDLMSVDTLGDEEDVKGSELGEDKEEEFDSFAPRVKIGPDGELIIDQESMFVKSSMDEERMNSISSDVIHESDDTRKSFSKKRKKTSEWTVNEVAYFYRALSQTGTDFSVMKEMFFKNWRTREQLKMKFKREERLNKALIDSAISNSIQYDLSSIQSEPEFDADAERAKEKAANKKSMQELKKRIQLQAQKQRVIERDNRKQNKLEEKVRKKILKKSCNQSSGPKRPRGRPKKIRNPDTSQNGSNDATNENEFVGATEPGGVPDDTLDSHACSNSEPGTSDVPAPPIIKTNNNKNKGTPKRARPKKVVIKKEEVACSTPADSEPVRRSTRVRKLRKVDYCVVDEEAAALSPSDIEVSDEEDAEFLVGSSCSPILPFKRKKRGKDMRNITLSNQTENGSTSDCNDEVSSLLHVKQEAGVSDLASAQVSNSLENTENITTSESNIVSSENTQVLPSSTLVKDNTGVTSISNRRVSFRNEIECREAPLSDEMDADEMPAHSNTETLISNCDNHEFMTSDCTMNASSAVSNTSMGANVSAILEDPSACLTKIDLLDMSLSEVSDTEAHSGGNSIVKVSSIATCQASPREMGTFTNITAGGGSAADVNDTQSGTSYTSPPGAAETLSDRVGVSYETTDSAFEKPASENTQTIRDNQKLEHFSSASISLPGTKGNKPVVSLNDKQSSIENFAASSSVDDSKTPYQSRRPSKSVTDTSEDEKFGKSSLIVMPRKSAKRPIIDKSDDEKSINITKKSAPRGRPRKVVIDTSDEEKTPARRRRNMKGTQISPKLTPRKRKKKLVIDSSEDEEDNVLKDTDRLKVMEESESMIKLQLQGIRLHELTSPLPVRLVPRSSEIDNSSTNNTIINQQDELVSAAPESCTSGNDQNGTAQQDENLLNGNVNISCTTNNSLSSLKIGFQSADFAEKSNVNSTDKVDHSSSDHESSYCQDFAAADMNESCYEADLESCSENVENTKIVLENHSTGKDINEDEIKLSKPEGSSYPEQVSSVKPTSSSNADKVLASTDESENVLIFNNEIHSSAMNSVSRKSVSPQAKSILDSTSDITQNPLANTSSADVTTSILSHSSSTPAEPSSVSCQSSSVMKQSALVVDQSLSVTDNKTAIQSPTEVSQSLSSQSSSLIKESVIIKKTSSQTSQIASTTATSSPTTSNVSASTQSSVRRSKIKILPKLNPTTKQARLKAARGMQSKELLKNEPQNLNKNSSNDEVIPSSAVKDDTGNGQVIHSPKTDKPTIIDSRDVVSPISETKEHSIFHENSEKCEKLQDKLEQSQHAESKAQSSSGNGVDADFTELNKNISANISKTEVNPLLKYINRNIPEDIEVKNDALVQDTTVAAIIKSVAPKPAIIPGKNKSPLNKANHQVPAQSSTLLSNSVAVTNESCHEVDHSVLLFDSSNVCTSETPNNLYNKSFSNIESSSTIATLSEPNGVPKTSLQNITSTKDSSHERDSEELRVRAARGPKDLHLPNKSSIGKARALKSTSGQPITACLGASEENSVSSKLSRLPHSGNSTTKEIIDDWCSPIKSDTSSANFTPLPQKTPVYVSGKFNSSSLSPKVSSPKTSSSITAYSFAVSPISLNNQAAGHVSDDNTIPRSVEQYHVNAESTSENKSSYYDTIHRKQLVNSECSSHSLSHLKRVPSATNSESVQFSNVACDASCKSQDSVSDGLFSDVAVEPPTALPSNFIQVSDSRVQMVSNQHLIENNPEEISSDCSVVPGQSNDNCVLYSPPQCPQSDYNGLPHADNVTSLPYIAGGAPVTLPAPIRQIKESNSPVLNPQATLCNPIVYVSTRDVHDSNRSHLSPSLSHHRMAIHHPAGREIVTPNEAVHILNPDTIMAPSYRASPSLYRSAAPSPVIYQHSPSPVVYQHSPSPVVYQPSPSPVVYQHSPSPSLIQRASPVVYQQPVGTRSNLDTVDISRASPLVYHPAVQVPADSIARRTPSQLIYRQGLSAASPGVPRGSPVLYQHLQQPQPSVEGCRVLSGDSVTHYFEVNQMFIDPATGRPAVRVQRSSSTSSNPGYLNIPVPDPLPAHTRRIVVKASPVLQAGKRAWTYNVYLHKS